MLYESATTPGKLKGILKMKILIVDDTKLSRNIIIKRLPESIKDSAVIIQGENGEEAVNLYKEHKPDIVFLDLTMPVMDGFEALRLIMEFDSAAVIYVITADIQAKSKEQVLGLGATSVDSKPISPERLNEIIETALAKQ